MVRNYDMEGWLKSTHLVVCVGAGGVGKTTTAATIGLAGALRGRKAMVLTIDPAKRLANSLGLNSIGNEETQIDLSSISDGEGELWAMMLDSRSTFDALITRIAPDEAARDRILSNHVYRHMADTFAGSQDYMATEKLYDIVNSGKYDLVVLDTPPVKNALDFLESPGRLINFLDERVLKWFSSRNEKKGFFSGLLMGTQAVVQQLLGAVFGNDFLDDLGTFFEDFQGLYDGFVLRNNAVVKLFRSPDTQFMTVCAPTESSIDVATFFQEELASRDLPRGGVVVNQLHSCSAETHDANQVLGDLVTKLGAGVEGKAVLARLGMAHRRLRALVDTEEHLTKKVRGISKGGFYQEVPRLDGNVHDLKALNAVATALFEQATDLRTP